MFSRKSVRHMRAPLPVSAQPPQGRCGPGGGKYHRLSFVIAITMAFVAATRHIGEPGCRLHGHPTATTITTTTTTDTTTDNHYHRTTLLDNDSEPAHHQANGQPNGHPTTTADPDIYHNHRTRPRQRPNHRNVTRTDTPPDDITDLTIHPSRTRRRFARQITYHPSGLPQIHAEQDFLNPPITIDKRNNQDMNFLTLEQFVEFEHLSYCHNRLTMSLEEQAFGLGKQSFQCLITLSYHPGGGWSKPPPAPAHQIPYPETSKSPWKTLKISTPTNWRPWSRAGQLQIALNHSRPNIIYHQGKCSNKVVQVGIFGSYQRPIKINPRFKSLVLLLAGDVELNPGPLNLNKYTKEQLTQALNIFKGGDPAFPTPTTKEGLIIALGSENEGMVDRIMRNIVPNVSTPASTHSTTEPPASIKLTPFCEAEVRQWFNQIEQLLIGLPVQSQKNSLLRTVPTNIIRECGADVTADFNTIKQSIITHFEDSQAQKLRKLLNQQELGDHKPSTALRKLEQLAPGNDSLIKLRFLEMLPREIRVVLASLEETCALAKLAEVADKLYDQVSPIASGSSNVSALSTTPHVYSNATHCNASQNAPASQLQLLTDNQLRMQEQILQLTKTLTQLSTSPARGRSPVRDSQERTRNTSRSRSPSTGRFNRSRFCDPTGRYCFYHFQFGKEARKCAEPCSWNQGVGNEDAPAP